MDESGVTAELAEWSVKEEDVVFVVVLVERSILCLIDARRPNGRFSNFILVLRICASCSISV